MISGPIPEKIGTVTPQSSNSAANCSKESPPSRVSRTEATPPSLTLVTAKTSRLSGLLVIRTGSKLSGQASFAEANLVPVTKPSVLACTPSPGTAWRNESSTNQPRACTSSSMTLHDAPPSSERNAAVSSPDAPENPATTST